MFTINIDDEYIQSIGKREIDSHITKKLFTHEDKKYQLYYILKPLYNVIINGKSFCYTENKASYFDIVNMAMESLPVYHTHYSVTYRNGIHPQSEGVLSNDETVSIQSGMIFNIAMTDNA